ncbi:hypothetical protein FRB94_008964 [Tulasnella sp. JGI-2019a]|nr:hypothetical protein FRB93_003504 [Tulasnella sp. JGI-2019a]KAG9014806.1 hypothetical protein FRB94_008964 [Tulasnella sp. JGI-2019a]
MATPSASITDTFANITSRLSSQPTDLESLATLLPSHPTQRSTVTVYTLSNDNPSKTQLYDDSTRRATYDVHVDFNRKRPMTCMRHLNADGSDGETFGCIEWHDFWPDQISFKGAKMIRKSSFFTSAGPMSYAVRFKDDQGRKYTWKGLGAGLQLELRAEDNFNPKVPIAQFQRTRYDRSTEPATPFPAMLFLTSRAMEIKELVIFTFFVLEKARRTNENSELNRADGEKTQSVFGSGGVSIGDGVGGGVKR